MDIKPKDVLKTYLPRAIAGDEFHFEEVVAVAQRLADLDPERRTYEGNEVHFCGLARAILVDLGAK